MSRIGNKPIVVPAEVEVLVEAGALRMKGSKGELTVSFDAKAVAFELKDGELRVTRKNELKDSRAKHGLYRSLAANAIGGVKDGYQKKLEIIGVGYRGALKGSEIELNLGYSHPINYAIPAGVTAEFDKENTNLLVISGIDKQLVGQVAAEIREFRKPEPYKGKGIRYQDEYIYRKAGKSAAK